MQICLHADLMERKLLRMTNYWQTLALLVAISSLSSCSLGGNAAPLPANTLIVHRDLAYTKEANDSCRLDLYLPKNHKALIPVLLWVHGGGWDGGR